MSPAETIVTKENRKGEKRKPKRVRPPGGYCNANKKNGGGFCHFPAGWGTEHVGIGRCRLHGGNTRNHMKKAAIDESKKFYGAPIEMNALDALMWCIKISAGEVAWLSNQIANVKEDEWLEDSIVGKQVNIWVRERHDALDRLARHSEWAIKLGLAERAVKMSEMYGEMLYRLLQGIFDDLELTTAQRQKTPEIIRRRLIEVQTTSSDLELNPAAGSPVDVVIERNGEVLA